jgi:dolichyl-phosphate-mannose-protein mannosyltransferase
MTATEAGQPAEDPQSNRTDTGSTDVGTIEAGAVEAGLVDTDASEADPLSDSDAGISSQAGTSSAERIAALRARLLTPMPTDRLWGWIGPLLVTLFAGILRFDRLSTPNAIMFDETYYAKDAWSILKHGVEWQWLPAANAAASNTQYVNNQIVAGHFTESLFSACSGTACGEYVVQPEVGKLLIAVGEWIWGLTAFGWRAMPALFGTLAVLLLCRITRRMTRSTLLGCLAGLLMSLDGLEFVLSRTGILDIFLMFFVLASFGCLVVDRDVSRARLAEAMVLRPTDEAGPSLGIRWWRVLAGVMIGVAGGTKQDALWYAIAFIGLCITWDIGARRAVGLKNYVRGAITGDGKWLPLSMVAVPAVVYVLTWMNWLVTNTGYNRDYAQSVKGINIPVISPLISLFNYQQQIYKFMSTLSTGHPYMSQPWDWFFMTRPVAFYWNTYTDPAGQHLETQTNVVGPYVREVLAIGNPAIWWVSVPAMAVCLYWWATRRDWRAGVALLGVAAGWVTWLPFPSRTKFFYYALEFEPFMIICIVLCLGLIIGPATASLARRLTGSMMVGVYLIAVLVVFWYFYPILTGEAIPYQDWLNHMWYTGVLGPVKGWI